MLDLDSYSAKSSMSEEQHGGNQNIRPSILSSVISSGSGSSISPLSSLRATGQAAASAAQGIYLQPQAERDNESHSDSANPTCTPFVQQVQPILSMDLWCTPFQSMK